MKSKLRLGEFLKICKCRFCDVHFYYVDSSGILRFFSVIVTSKTRKNIGPDMLGCFVTCIRPLIHEGFEISCDYTKGVL